MTPCHHHRQKRALLGAVCAFGLACGPALAAPVVSADTHTKTKLKGMAEHVSKEPFGHIPKGPLQIVISVDQQKLHLYSDGAHVADTLVATGVRDHPTPLGVFSVIQKSLYHHSNIYSGAPMPYMQRITWSGVAMHEGGNLGHPASHGCIRMSHDFATRLWALTKLGAGVVIARPELRPENFSDPHLFVHQVEPTTPAPIASIAAAAPVPLPASLQTAQTTDGGKATDVPSAAGKDAAGAAVDPPASAAEAPQPSEPGSSKTATTTPAGVQETVPKPLPKPAEIAHASKAPIAIFISRRDKKIYVRQDFSPLFDAPITIDRPQQLIGTHVFTALAYLDDKSTFRWTVISLPGELPKMPPKIERENKSAKPNRHDGQVAKPTLDPPPPESPRQALARIEIPKDTIDRISQLIVPGSSLIVSDQGLGEETGEGTGFIVVAR